MVGWLDNKFPQILSLEATIVLIKQLGSIKDGISDSLGLPLMVTR